MATTATSTISAQAAARWEARAITLAEEQHLVHRARFVGKAISGESLYEVPSKALDGTLYLVQVWSQNMRVVCSCGASSWARACGYCGTGLLAERQRQAAERGSEGDTALRWFCHTGAW